MNARIDVASRADVLDRFQVLRSDPAARGARGGLDPISAHRRRTATSSRHRPATLVAGHDDDENRPSRLHLNNTRFWSERWGPPQALAQPESRSRVERRLIDAQLAAAGVEQWT